MKTINTLLFVFLSVTSLKAQYNFRIEANVHDNFDNLQITLLVKDNIGRYTEQTKQALVQKGKFYMTGNIDQPCKRATIQITKAGKLYKGDFFLDTVNKIQLLIQNTQYGALKIVSSSRSALIKYKLDSIHSAAYMKYRKENNIPDSAFSSLPMQEGHQLALDKLKIMTEEYPNDYASLLSFYYFSRWVGMTNYFGLIKSSLSKFSPTLQASALGRKIYENCEKESIAYDAAIVGKHMIPFKVKDIIDGKEISNESLLGKPYILAFTAIWCVPCQESLPQLKALYERYKDKGLKVIYCYSPSKSDMMKVKEHVQKNNLSWINIFDADKNKYLGARLFVHYVPTYMLIDKQGKMVYNSAQTTEGMDPLEGYLKKMF